MSDLSEAIGSQRLNRLVRAGASAAARLGARRGPGRNRAATGSEVPVPLSIFRDEVGQSALGSAVWRPRLESVAVAVPALELIGDGAQAVYALELPPGSGFRCLLRGPEEGAARATLSLCSASGALLAAWSQTLRVRAGWTEFRADFPAKGAGERRWLCLSCASERDGPARVAWGAPELLLPEEHVPVRRPAPIGEPAGESGPPQPELALDPDSPVLSVLMPVHDPELEHLQAAIDSVRAQTFPGWQLCLSDDGSRDPAVHELLERLVAEDPRITLTRTPWARGISAASNAALELAAGPYVVLVDHDDLIAPEALELVAARLRAEPWLDMLYSDEDRCSEDGRARSHLFMKPGWSPELFRSAMYTCHLGVYRRSLVQELGGFRSEFDGAQDYDLVLRLIERTERIGHLPQVLYTWRMHPGSTASGFMAKPRAAELACVALAEHLERTGVAGTVELGPLPGWYRVRPRVDRWTRVAILLPVPAAPRGVAESHAFGDSLRAWSLAERPGTEIFLIGGAETLRECVKGVPLSAVEAAQIRFCDLGGDRHWTELVNAGAAEADAELLLLCPGAIGPRDQAWWEQLVGLAAQPEVAAAGGTLLGARGEIDRGAIAFGDGWPLQVGQGRTDFAYPFLFGNFRALGGPVVLRAGLFESLGGLDPDLGELAIADLCLCAGVRGLRSVLCAEAIFAPALPGSAPPAPGLLAAFRRRWLALGPDPYYNRGYWQGRGDFDPAVSAALTPAA